MVMAGLPSRSSPRRLRQTVSDGMDEKGDELDPEWGGGEVLLEDYVALVETALPGRQSPSCRGHAAGDGELQVGRTGTLTSHCKLCGAPRNPRNIKSAKSLFFWSAADQLSPQQTVRFLMVRLHKK